VAVAYATASSSVDDRDAAVGITLSQFVASSSSYSQSDSQLPQHHGGGSVTDVTLEFVSIPLLSRAHRLYRSTRCDYRSVLNILDSLLANQIPAKGVVTIVCRIEIRKMAEC